MRLFKSNSKKHEAVQFYVQPSKVAAPKHGLALAVIVKNEAASIAEWLRFHKAAGVDRFILYDDGSTDTTIENAINAVGQDALMIIPWGQRIQDAALQRAIHNQGLAFAHAIGNFRQDFRWMGFIDIDEFLFPTQANSLAELLDALPHVDNILLPWQMFGRQGFATTPEQVLPNYTHRYRDPFDTTVKGVLNFKCLVNPSKVTKTYVHGFETNGNQTIWNSNGQTFQFGQHRSPEFHQDAMLQLNHYYVKSDAQLSEKTDKGSIGDSTFTAAFKKRSDRADMLTRRLSEIERDTVEDRGILDFCDRIGFEYP
ncbi:glycosyl transferase family 92 [Yoonia maricola]|uniref:Glycosyl transferase family 92 n=1 Tax=Yoonia maricola TaxID=420999 RepID=A0A2M8W4H0_9RHOB|nr:glycosyltransferase family 92 protein [Yoonia maricola]PJI85821.1 glycosyl transferase family 92 [Yoonia maricola]